MSGVGRRQPEAAAGGRRSQAHSGVGRRQPGQRGDIIVSWLVQLLMTMAVLALVAHEVLTIGITAVTLEDTARAVAVAGRDAYRDSGNLDTATAAATAAATERAVALESLAVDGDDVVAVIEKQAGTLITHRIGPLEDLTAPSARGRARWRP